MREKPGANEKTALVLRQKECPFERTKIKTVQS